jgi:hypothetical protein
VTATFVHTDEGDMTELTVTSPNGQTGTIDATSWHPVYNDDSDTFIPIGDLRPGTSLRSADSTTPTVTGIRHYARFQPVYDLTVNIAHTYNILTTTDTTVLVHNCGEPDVDALSASAKTSRPGVPSPAERAYQKHSEPSKNRPNPHLPAVRSGKERSAVAHDLVDDILTDPRTAVQAYNHTEHGPVYDFRLPDGGAQWSQNGNFIGFLGP